MNTGHKPGQVIPHDFTESIKEAVAIDMEKYPSCPKCQATSEHKVFSTFSYYYCSNCKEDVKALSTAQAPITVSEVTPDVSMQSGLYSVYVRKANSHAAQWPVMSFPDIVDKVRDTGQYSVHFTAIQALLRFVDGSVLGVPIHIYKALENSLMSLAQLVKVIPEAKLYQVIYRQPGVLGRVIGTRLLDAIAMELKEEHSIAMDANGSIGVFFLDGRSLTLNYSVYNNAIAMIGGQK